VNLPRVLVLRVAIWLLEWPQLRVCILGLLIAVSSLGTIYSEHVTRRLYGQLQQLESSQDFLDNEYEKLMLEQSAWAAYARVDQISKSELNMSSPAVADIVVVTR
jgi:cell division protein FtsL